MSILFPNICEKIIKNDEKARNNGNALTDNVNNFYTNP